jgi:hypothetical protein
MQSSLPAARKAAALPAWEAICFFASGIAGAFYGVVWAKESAYGAPISRRLCGPRINFLLELGVGVRGLLMPPRIPPWVRMGATLPVLVGHFDRKHVGRALVRIYRSDEAAFPDLTSQLGIRSYPALGMVARLYSIRYALILDTGLTPLRTTAAARVLSEPLPRVKLAHLDDVLPRVYLPGQVRRLPHAEVARHLQDTAVVSGRQVLVSSTEGDRLTGDLAEPQACSVSSFANTQIAVSCSASSPTMAVFVEQYDAGWTAVVDGQPAKIERANLFLRGVSLPAGLHRIEMHYRPPGLSLAAFISAIGLLVLVAGMLRRGQAERGNSS